MPIMMKCYPRRSSRKIHLLLFVWTLILLLKTSEAISIGSWMYLGMSSLTQPLHDSSTCNHIPFLVNQQQEVCKRNPQSMMCIGHGARKGISECQYQFKYERWNCTTHRSPSVFGKLLEKGTKETAFIHAIASAGVVHAVTLSCSDGNLTDCSCDMSLQGNTVEKNTNWRWGGCSDNIKYGLWFGQTFVDAPEITQHKNNRNVRNLVNLHNNKVGRQIIEENMAIRCRCHGVSGSCAVKSCWRSMPSFRKIGDVLKSKYESSIEVGPRSRKKLRRRQKRHRKIRIPDNMLVHMHRSPNFCQTDSRKGILGTRGRACEKYSDDGADSCTMLCCGRGYNTKVEKTVTRCHCKFYWCCKVKCKTCVTKQDVHTCK
uniref:Protein Wnt n=1 Tax=Terebratalia transversa TaxID=34513 RepID=A0AAU7EAA5_TERTR